MRSATRPLSRRSLLTAGAGAATAGALGLTAGCGRPPGSLGRNAGELTVWTWPDNDLMFMETIPAFEKANPGITVKVQGFQGGDNYIGKLLGALVSGTGPDVAMIEITYISTFKGKPGFQDLSQAPFNARELKDKYVASHWGYVEDDIRDTVFALPKNPAPGGMFYRRDVFEKAGLPTEPDEVNQAMKTWDDFVEQGRKVVAGGGRKWLVDEADSIANVLRLQSGVWYFDDGGDPQLTHPKFTEAAEFLLRLQKDKLLAPKLSAQERSAGMGSGALATLFNGNWMGGQLKNFLAPKSGGKWGVSHAPAGEDGTSAFSQGGDFIGILESSRHKRAAWEFISWVTQSDTSLKAMYGRDLYPGWKPALDAPWLNQPDDFYAGQNVNEVFAEVSENLKVPVTNAADATARQALKSALESIVYGGVPVKRALAGAQDEVEVKLR